MHRGRAEEKQSGHGRSDSCACEMHVDASETGYRIWDLRMKKEALIIKHHKNQITSVIFNHESPHLISSSKDARVCLWDIIAFECTTCLITHPSGVRETKLHPAELKFASLCSYTLNIWRLDGLKIKKFNIFKNVSLFSFKSHNEFVTVDKQGWMKFFKCLYAQSWSFLLLNL